MHGPSLAAIGTCVKCVRRANDRAMGRDSRDVRYAAQNWESGSLTLLFSAFAAHHKTEMFHDVGYVCIRTVNAGPLQRLIQNTAGRPDKRRTASSSGMTFSSRTYLPSSRAKLP